MIFRRWGLFYVCRRLSYSTVSEGVKELTRKVKDASYNLSSEYKRNETEILNFCHANKLHKEVIALATDRLTKDSEISSSNLRLVFKILENAGESSSALFLTSLAMRVQLPQLNDPKLWISALKCCSAGESSISLKVFDNMMQSCSTPHYSSIDAVMKCFPPKTDGIRAKQYAFKLSKQLKLPYPTLTSLAHVFDCFSSNPNGDSDIAFRLMNDVISEYASGRLINSTASDLMCCFHYAIQATCLNFDFVSSLHLLDGLIRLGLTPTEEMWCNVIKSVSDAPKIRNRRIRSKRKVNGSKLATITQSRHLLQEMMDAGYTVTVLSWNSLLFVCSKSGLLNDMIDIRQEMRTRMIDMNKESWKYCVLTCIQANNLKEALTMFHLIAIESIESVASKLMTACVDTHDIASGGQLLQILKKMGGQSSIGLLNLQLSCHTAETVSLAYEFIKNMKAKYGISPDVNSWSLLVKLVVDPVDARKLILEMTNNNLQVTEEIWSMCIEKCHDSGNWQLADVLFADFLMERKRIKTINPSSRMWSSLLALHVKAGRRTEYDALLGLWDRCK